MVPEGNSGRLQRPLKHRRNTANVPMKVESMARLILSTVLIITLAAPAAANAMVPCPNGSFVAGSSCKQAPDGSYISGDRQARLAPNGTYTSGPPVLTPKGNYISGDGRMTMCSDGTYVMGSCKLAPNGKYIGE